MIVGAARSHCSFVRRFFLLGLVGCSGTVSLGNLPSEVTAGGVQADAGEATPARASDAGALCSAGQPIVNDFEHGGVVGTDPSFEGVVAANSIAGFSGIEVGATQPLPPTAAGTFWLDDLKISSDGT